MLEEFEKKSRGLDFQSFGKNLVFYSIAKLKKKS